MNKIINFGRTWSFTPSKILFPSSSSELQEIVKNSKKLRTVGSKHSWSKGIVTDDTLVSLDRMDKIIKLDKQNHQACIQAGKKLKDIIKELEKEGYAFINLGSIHEQSLAGAITTATHGTGHNFQCLASQVISFKMIDGQGNDREFTKNDPEFYAIITGFGSFGVIYEILLSVTPSFQIHAITDNMPFQEFIENLSQYTEVYDHFKFWWLPPNDHIIVFKNNRTNEPKNDSDFLRFVKDELVSVGVYRLLVKIGKLNRQKFIPKINNFLTKEVGNFYDRIVKSYIGFLTPVPPVHRETEWAFDYQNAKELLTEYRQLLLNDGHTYNFVQEIRFTKGDEFWLSPAYKRDTIWLTVYNIDKEINFDDQLAKFETWAQKNGGRPHWGKEASFDANYLNGQYVKMTEFKALTTKMDPQMKFVNDWIKKVLNH